VAVGMTIAAPMIPGSLATFARLHERAVALHLGKHPLARIHPDGNAHSVLRRGLVHSFAHLLEFHDYHSDSGNCHLRGQD